jgi:hypothetical protein
MKDKVFLIGNGINNLKQDYQWSDLINNLIRFIGATGQIRTSNKPFPLLYEEIFVEAVKNRGFSEYEIKEFIAKEANKLKPNEIHQDVLDFGIQNILTTNYDFTFENQLINSPNTLKNDGIVKENRYSIFRHYSIDNINIWHIHGDANYPTSITLGYEHYSGYLQQMRNYVVTGTGTSYKIKLDPLTKRIKTNDVFKYYSWLDFFFKNNVYIIGLTLDFIEIHLWWLLTFRQRAKLTKRLHIDNKIFYFYPHTLREQIQNKLELLQSNGVIPFSCNYNEINRIEYYKEVLKKIKNGT